jgi:hypothetical protein
MARNKSNIQKCRNKKHVIRKQTSYDFGPFPIIQHYCFTCKKVVR